MVNVERKSLFAVMLVGIAALLYMFFSSYAGTDVDVMRWKYFDVSAALVAAFAAYYLLNVNKEVHGKNLAWLNGLSSAALLYGHLLDGAAMYAKYHVWSLVDGFLLATWLATALFLNK